MHLGESICLTIRPSIYIHGRFPSSVHEICETRKTLMKFPILKSNARRHLETSLCSGRLFLIMIDFLPQASE